QRRVALLLPAHHDVHVPEDRRRGVRAGAVAASRDDAGDCRIRDAGARGLSDAADRCGGRVGQGAWNLPRAGPGKVGFRLTIRRKTRVSDLVNFFTSYGILTCLRTA